MIPLLIISFVLLVLVIGGVAVVTSRDDDDAGSTSGQAGSSGGVTDTASSDTDTRDTASSATQPDDAAAAPPATVPADPTTAPSTTPTAPDPRAEALLSLADRLETDRPSVDAHLERWVPQLSAKRDGLVWQDTEFGFPEIWAEHLDLDARYGALLVSGAEYTFELDGQRMDGWFITIADQSWPDPDGALNWCRSNGIDRDNCAAKLITNNPGTDRTFVTQ